MAHLERRHALNDYALWLMPHPDALPALEQTVAELAAVAPTSPAFDPHVTLLHPIPLDVSLSVIQERVQGIIKDLGLGTLHLHAGPAKGGETYYQCVFYPVELSTGLASLRAACEDAFGMHKPFMPHLSLKYGDLNEEDKATIASTVQKKEGPIPLVEVAIARLVGVADEWEILSRIPL